MVARAALKLVLAAAPTPGQRHRQAENLGLRYLASCARAGGHDVLVLDETDGDQSVADFADKVAATSPDMVGFGVQFAAQALPTVEAAAILRRRRPRCGLIVGGQALNFAWQDILDMGPSFDAAACFEAERGLSDFIRWWSMGRRDDPPSGFYIRDGESTTFTGFAEPIADLDSIPFPLRDSQSRAYGEPNFVMLSSRGCQSSCTFCSSGFFGNRYHSQERWRARSIDNLMAEITSLVKDHHARAVSFADDDFLGGKATASAGRERALRLVSALRASTVRFTFSIEARADEILAGHEVMSRLTEVGLAHILIGIDGLTARDLKLYGKRTTLAAINDAVGRIAELGITASYGAILFNPLTSCADLREGIQNLESLGVAKSDHLTNQLQLYRGSPLIGYLEKRDANIRWEPSLFRYDYMVSDDVAGVHSRFCELARAVKPVELRLARANFRISTGIGMDTRDPRTDVRNLRGNLLTVERDLSRQLCDSAYAAIDTGGPPMTRELQAALGDADDLAMEVIRN